MNEIPEDFELIFRSSPYLDLLGPIYNKRTDAGLTIGLKAEEKHCNARNLFMAVFLAVLQILPLAIM